MKITREIMGQMIEIDLTEEEMAKIAEEVQTNEDRIYVNAWLTVNGYENADEIPKSLMAELVERYQLERKGLDEGMGTNQIPAVEAAVQYFAEELAEYKEKWKVFTKKVTLTLTREYTIRARNQEESDRIFDRWSENHSRQMADDLTENAEYMGEYDYGSSYEDECADPDDAEISEEDV